MPHPDPPYHSWPRPLGCRRLAACATMAALCLVASAPRVCQVLKSHPINTAVLRRYRSRGNNNRGTMQR